MPFRHKHGRPPEITDDDLADLVDARFREFLAAMAAAGNPGAQDYACGWSTRTGWLVRAAWSERSAERVVLGTDGFVHVLGDSLTRNTKHLTASEWLFADPPGLSLRELGRRFSQQLSGILASHDVPDE